MQKLNKHIQIKKFQHKILVLILALIIFVLFFILKSIYFQIKYFKLIFIKILQLHSLQLFLLIFFLLIFFLLQHSLNQQIVLSSNLQIMNLVSSSVYPRNDNQQTMLLDRQPRVYCTNNVLIDLGLPDKSAKEEDQIVQHTVYLPGYLRVKLKNITSMQLGNLLSQINATLIFNIYYGDLFQSHQIFSEVYGKKRQGDKNITFKDQIIRIMSEQILLNFSHDDAVLLSQQTDGEKNLQTVVDHQQKKKIVKFTVRKTFHMHLEGNLFWSPFQIIDSIFQITVQQFEAKMKYRQNLHKWLFKINLMDHPSVDIKLSYGEEKTFGHYGLAPSRLKAIYTNQRIEKIEQFNMTEKARKIRRQERKRETQFKKEVKNKQQKKKVKYFQYAIFNIPMYKFPLTSLATIFFPLWLLNIINLGIFFQDSGLADRIASIAALMIAFVAFIPTMRQTIPPSSRIVFVQILIYFSVLANLIALVQSWNIMTIPVDEFQFIWYESWQYIIACIITGLSFFSIFLMMILHYAYWARVYEEIPLTNPNQDLLRNRTQYNPNKNTTPSKKPFFFRQEWGNSECDKQFNEVFNFKEIPKKKKEKLENQISALQENQNSPKKENKKKQECNNYHYFILQKKDKQKKNN